MRCFRTDNDLVEYYISRLREVDYEVLYFSYIDITKRWILGELEKTVYQKDNTGEVTIPEVLRSAILSKADYMLMLHNHIGEDPEPSSNDMRLSYAVYLAGNLMEIPLFDSIVISKDDIFSFKENDIF